MECGSLQDKNHIQTSPPVVVDSTDFKLQKEDMKLFRWVQLQSIEKLSIYILQQQDLITQKMF